MGVREMDDARKLKLLRVKDNNIDARVYVVDGKQLKSILKEPKESKITASGLQQLQAGIAMEVVEGAVYIKNFPRLASNRSNSAGDEDLSFIPTGVQSELHDSYASIVNDQVNNNTNDGCKLGLEAGNLSTLALKPFNGLLSPTSANDVGGLDANDVELNGGKALMLDAYTSSMSGEAWGRINFACALIDVSSELDLKKEVTMAVPNDDETDYMREVISVEYEWQPPRKKGATRRRADMETTTKNKVEGPSTSNSFDALNTLDIEDECGTYSSRSNQVEDQEARHKVSQLNEHIESDDEVDAFIFPEGDKFGDKFDIQQKGRVRK
nr:zinc knuckle CX2CX4HX4C [Tanacetum cinerariifolium]